MLGLKRFAPVFVALIVSMGAAAQSTDDSVTLVSGEILRGMLLDIDDDVITFRTRHGTRTYLPSDQIQSMSTVEARVVKTTDGKSAVGRLSKDGDELIVFSEDTTEAMDFSNVTQIEPAAMAERESSTTVSSVETGVLFRDGNRSRVDLYARIELDRTAHRYAWNWNSLIALDGRDHFPAYFRSEFDWQGTPLATRAPFLLLGLERDLDAAIDARAFAATGLEQRLLRQSNLRAGVGLGLVYESFDGGDLRSTRGLENVGKSVTSLDTDLDLLLRLIYKTQLTDRLSYHDELRVMPSLTDFGDLRASYDSGLTWALRDGLDVNLQLRIDYDDNPPLSKLDSWRAAIGAGLRVRFGVR